jgi:hypothetical protein
MKLYGMTFLSDGEAEINSEKLETIHDLCNMLYFSDGASVTNVNEPTNPF